MDWHAHFELDEQTNMDVAAPGWYGRNDELSQGVTFGWGNGSTHVSMVVTAKDVVEAAAVASDRLARIRAEVDIPGEILELKLADYYTVGYRSGILSGVAEAAVMLGVTPARVVQLASEDPTFPEQVAETRAGRFWLTWSIETYADRRRAKVEKLEKADAAKKAEKAKKAAR